MGFERVRSWNTTEQQMRLVCDLGNYQKLIVQAQCLVRVAYMEFDSSSFEFEIGSSLYEMNHKVINCFAL